MCAASDTSGFPHVGVSRLGFGTATLAALNSRKQVWKLLDTALESGITHYDTARLYGDGLMERTISPFIRSNRDRITITSKFGLGGRWKGNLACAVIPPARRLMKSVVGHRNKNDDGRPDVTTPPWPTLSPDVMRKSLDISLRELNVDCIDVFLMHEARREQISLPLLEALEHERQAGKIRSYGSGGEWNNTTSLNSLPWQNPPVIQAPTSVFLFENGQIQSMPKPDILHSIFRGVRFVEREVLTNPDAAFDCPDGPLEPGETLPRLFLQWALSRYPDSLVLFGARSEGRIIRNVANASAAWDNELFEAQIGWLGKTIARIDKESSART
jgi:D-threo-aldose 1-dehydrogenase